jgi:hypothetical protein
LPAMGLGEDFFDIALDFLEVLLVHPILMHSLKHLFRLRQHDSLPLLLGWQLRYSRLSQSHRPIRESHETRAKRGQRRDERGEICLAPQALIGTRFIVSIIIYSKYYLKLELGAKRRLTLYIILIPRLIPRFGVFRLLLPPFNQGAPYLQKLSAGLGSSVLSLFRLFLASGLDS